MCNQYLLKFKACGHFEEDLHIVTCENFIPTKPYSCPVWYHGTQVIKEYTPGDGDCRQCASRKAIDNQWFRAIGLPQDPDANLAFLTARAYLFLFDYISMEHLQMVQDQLIKKYIQEGLVLDVDATLRELGYDIPELPNRVTVQDFNTAPVGDLNLGEIIMPEGEALGGGEAAHCPSEEGEVGSSDDVEFLFEDLINGDDDEEDEEEDGDDDDDDMGM